MKRVFVISSLVVLAAVLVALIAFSRQKSPLEIVRLSEALVSAKVQTYYRHPNAANLMAVTDAIANHRKAIERARLPRDVREAMDRNLDDQIWIVRGIAHNDHLKL